MFLLDKGHHSIFDLSDLFLFSLFFSEKEGLAVCILAVLVSLGKHDVDESENVI